MSFLVDTNIFIHARDGHVAVRRMFARHAGSVQISTLSLAELQRGMHVVSAETLLRRQRHDLLLATLSVLSFDKAAADAYGGILRQVGRIKSCDADHMLAGHALAIGATLVTDNEADFVGVAGLTLENWTFS